MNASWKFSLNISTDELETGLSRRGHTIVAVFLGLIMFFGFLNNLIVLILFCKFKALRNPVNMLLLNISLSDMLVCISGTTISFVSNIYGKWLGGEYGCRWYGFVNSCFGKSSTFLKLICLMELYPVKMFAGSFNSAALSNVILFQVH